VSEYRLSDEAEHDVAEIYRRGFWQFGEHQADKFYHQLIDSIELLSTFPQIGRSADNIYPDLRRIEFNPYTIFYLPRDYGVYVLRLMRQSQIVKSDYIAKAINANSSKESDS
jgi:toxin ParE1/3/4